MLENLDRLLRQTVHALFLILLFCLPLIFWIPNSEVFELPKMYFVYAMTTLIVGLWLARMVVRREIVVKRTPLDIPVLLFLISQIASTIYSIDPHISWFGWYGRFNGGLWSTISYTLLYYAFLSNRFTIYDLPARNAFSIADAGGRFMNKTILFSALLVACYAILQRFGIDRDFWVQDVVNRVFSTQGQPNWLAGYIVMIIPFTLMLMTKSKKQKAKSGDRNNKIVFCSLFFVLLTVLLFTKSRSGLLGFAVTDAVFWLTMFVKKESRVKSKESKKFLLVHTIIILLILFTDNPVKKIFLTPYSLLPTSSPTKSELGGTESGDIRRLVWSGALKIAKQNPVFGTGPETFGLTYWQIRPKEHNLTSEWNFLYNKAHNEWLNLAANTGVFGLGSHLLLLVWFIVWSFNQLKIRNSKSEIRNNDQNPKFKNSKLNSHGFDKSNFEFVSNFDIRASDLTTVALLAAVVGIETVNFFGFSTVTIGTYSYLFMAMAVAIESNEQKVTSYENIKRSKRPISLLSTFYFLLILFISIYLLSRVYFLFTADLQYNLGRQFYSAGIVGEALKPLSQAVDLAPGEPVFRNELAESLSIAALSAWENGDKDQAVKAKNEAVANFRIVSGQSKYNLIFTRTQAQMEFLMRQIDPDLAGEALILTQRAIYLSPTDPRGYYLLGRMYEELGDKTKAQDLYRRAIELKPDYEEAKKMLNTEY